MKAAKTSSLEPKVLGVCHRYWKADGEAVTCHLTALVFLHFQYRLVWVVVGALQQGNVYGTRRLFGMPFTSSCDIYEVGNVNPGFIKPKD